MHYETMTDLERSVVILFENKRERECKLGLEAGHDRTPARVSRDCRGSSLVKDGKSLRRDSPHHDALHMWILMFYFVSCSTKIHAIFVPNLPTNATVEQLEAVFNNFGHIKHNGIQVRSSKQQGTCFGFVEFESASSMQSAIKLTMTEGGFLDGLVIEMITLGAVETSMVGILVEAVAMGRNEFERRGDFSKEVYKMIYKLQLKLKEVVL
uniref:RRM domain-containing protein n=1 Tax=Quercus lobata TaxID=97700 RepID=A0A7N2LAF0_QUELO